MAPEDAPSMTAMKLMGGNFHEFNSNSTVMIVLEGQQHLGPDAHEYSWEPQKRSSIQVGRSAI